MRAKASAFATSGIAIALLSAMSFGLSGPFIKSLLNSGWSPGGTVLVRIACAAVVLVVIAVAVERRRPAIRGSVSAVVLYGIVAVALVQASFVFALQTLSVGVTLMIQFLAPVLVIGWEWLAHSRRPSRLTLTGSALALVGAAFVVDPFNGLQISASGLAWAFTSTLGLAGFFVISRRDTGSVSNLVFGAAGMTVGALVCAIAGLTGLLPIHTATAETELGSMHLPWYIPLVLLVLVSTAIPYIAGIAAVDRIGPTFASLVLLSEVLFGATFAWILLGQAVSVVQASGGACIVAGVALAHIGGASAPRSVSESAPPVQRNASPREADAIRDTARAPLA